MAKAHIAFGKVSYKISNKIEEISLFPQQNIKRSHRYLFIRYLKGGRRGRDRMVVVCAISAYHQ